MGYRAKGARGDQGTASPHFVGSILDGDESVAAALLAQLAALTAEVRGLKGSPRSAKTLRELYNLYAVTLPQQENWIRNVHSATKPALELYGDRPADELTRADWLHYRDGVAAHVTTMRKGPPKASTLNLVMGRWNTIYRWGKEEGHVTTNPLAGIRPLRAKKHRETEPTDADVMKLRPHCDARLWAFIMLSYRSGMRASEVRKLEWRWIDLKKGRVRLPAHVTKTRKARAPRLTADALDALLAIKPDIPGRYVFESPVTGLPLVAAFLWRSFRKAADTAALEAAEGDGRVTFHDLRHGFMSGATRKGVRLQVVMKLAGQTSLSAAQRYLHTNEDDLDEAQRVLDTAVRSGVQRDGTEEIPPGQEKSR